MRITHVLSFLSIAVFGSALAVPRQQDPLAEQQFKNITALKGSKASDIIPSMEFMSASLGVSCDYCHTEDRSSDDKRPKAAAREMIAMQHEINAKNFGGRNQVTCATCHAGRTNPMSVPPVEGSSVRARRSQEVKPGDVLAAYGKAVGTGTSSQGFKLEGTGQAKGEKSKLEATYSGEKFTLMAHGAKGDQKQGFNGTLAWFSTPRGIQSVPLVYAAQYVNEKMLFTGPDSLPKLDNPGGATAKIGDRDMLVVNGTMSGSKTRVSFFFDKKTGLLARTQFGYPTILGNIIQINDLTDYRKVGGIQIPMTITSHSSEGDDVMHFTSAHADANISSTFFDPPK